MTTTHHPATAASRTSPTPWIARSAHKPGDALVEDLLEVLSQATWPDGSPLVDVAPGVLRARLVPQLLALHLDLAPTRSRP